MTADSGVWWAACSLCRPRWAVIANDLIISNAGSTAKMGYGGGVFLTGDSDGLLILWNRS